MQRERLLSSNYSHTRSNSAKSNAVCSVNEMDHTPLCLTYQYHISENDIKALEQVIRHECHCDRRLIGEIIVQFRLQ